MFFIPAIRQEAIVCCKENSGISVILGKNNKCVGLINVKVICYLLRFCVFLLPKVHISLQKELFFPQRGGYLISSYRHFVGRGQSLSWTTTASTTQSPRLSLKPVAV